MALFQVQLRGHGESTEVYCVLIVTDDGSHITFSFQVQVLDL